jgi:Domain of unknown function (DUF4389)
VIVGSVHGHGSSVRVVAPKPRSNFLTTTPQAAAYPARLDIDYPETLDRASTFFRLLLVIPIMVILTLISASATQTVTVVTDAGETISRVTQTGAGIAGGLFAATVLMILFRMVYPRWWFDFALALTRFQARIGAYLALMTDRYPSTVDEQSVHLDVEYPEVERDLNRWLPLVKWLLAFPHYVILGFLALIGLVLIIVAWFAILFTGRFPRGLFDYLVGVGRWGLRVEAYAFLLVTDRYPPFSMQ